MDGMRPSLPYIIACLFFVFVQTLSALDAAYENAPVHYSDSKENTELTRLFQRAEASQFQWDTGSDRAVLQQVLDELKIPVESQVLVFSKTSAQNSRISPQTPRAIYYSDDAYVGWVQGGNIEVATLDPKLGVVFHLIDLSEISQTKKPTLIRDRSCLNCHAGSSNHNFPGLMVRSLYPDDSGQPYFHAGSFHTRHDSPIEERWGGWYVTGSVEGHEHMGNSIAEEHENEGSETISLVPLKNEPVSELSDFFDTTPYMGGGKSDVVALMILEHQVGLHNELIRANLVTRQTLHRHKEMKTAFNEPLDSPLSETNQSILNHLADDILEQMLFADEIELEEKGIDGSIDYQTAFQANRKKDSEGRSLKDLRLYERLFKYRCSYLIYSQAFTDLPPVLKTIVLEKLLGILTDAPSYPDYAYLGSSERKRILQILRETLPDLPASWDQTAGKK